MEMKNYICIDGKKAELTPEQLKALGLETEMKSPFEREENQEYYYIRWDGYVIKEKDFYGNSDNKVHKVANYCTNMEMMQQQAYRETLNRLLWRYSMEHQGDELDWGTKVKGKCIIQYNHTRREFRSARVYTVEYVGSVTFATMEIAENAIREIIEPFIAEHPDFKL